MKIPHWISAAIMATSAGLAAWVAAGGPGAASWGAGALTIVNFAAQLFQSKVRIGGAS